MKKKILIITLILSFIILIPSTANASLVGQTPTNEYGIPLGATGLSLHGDEAVDANQDYVNFVNYLDESCEANGTCFKGGVGIFLQVIKYEGGKEIPIGHPLYIINDSLLVDLTTSNGAALPGSYDAFAAKNWGFTQFMAPECKNGDSWLVTGSPTEGEENNPNLAQRDYTMKGPDGTPVAGKTFYYNDYYSCQFDMSYCKTILYADGFKSKSDIKTGVKTDFIHKIMKYQTGLKKTTYPKSKIKNMPSSYINDSNLTESSIAAGYLNTTIEKKYVYISINKINSYYGTSLTDQDIGKYYIELQGVYRHLLPPEYVGPFLARTLQNKYKEENELTEADIQSYEITPDNEDDCPSGHWKKKVTSAEVPESCTRNSVNPGTTHACVLVNHACDDSSLCTYTAYKAEQSYHYCNTTVTRYKHSYEGCGIMNYHQLYGSYYEGESELLTTKAASNVKCDTSSTGTIADMITDENNRHCIIADADQQYSRKEEDNTCTTGYEYYIGPNQQEALVGTLSTSPYNMFIGNANKNKVPVGEKCRTGVKHFYVMDVTTDMCTDVCTNVTSDKTSDAYLKCAENFCENDVDYNLGGNPYLRKQNCILHSCNYSYGVDPETKSNNSKYRQSVSSCDNSSIYKDGTNYKKKSINQSTTCSMYGENSIDSLETNLSICYGQTITDYDDNVTNDERFDQRTYINIACQEVDKVSSITDVSKAVYVPGEPIDYALKVRGTISCIAFFDYEQWKVDYASIPRKDTIRKNRMKYLYDRFNNLIDESYTTADEYTKFSALDYSGKNYYNWNMELTNYGKISWDKYVFNSDKINASATVTEYQLDNSKQTTSEDQLVIGAQEVTNTRNPIDLHSTGKSYIYTGLKNRKLYSVENYNDVVIDTAGNSEMQAYMITSGTDIAYQFSKYCVDNDAKTIKKASGAKCSNGTNGKNEYYISFKAQATKDIQGNNNHNFLTQVSIESSLPIEQMYKDKTCTSTESRPPSVTYNDKDTCNYTVKRDVDDGYKCDISCTSVKPLGKGNYLKSLEVKLSAYENGVRYNSSKYNINVKSRHTNYDVESNKANVSITPGHTDSVEQFILTGTFTGGDNKNYSCKKVCTILNYVPSTPSCTVTKINDELYRINPVGNYNRVGVTILRDTLDEEDIVDIKADKQGRYLVEVKNTSYETDLVITGHVEGPDGSNTCPYEDQVIIVQEYNCPAKYKPGEYEAIKAYCDVYFLKDVNNYTDPEDCLQKCIPCPDGVEPYEDTEIKINKNINIIKKDYCMKWSENKYNSYESCINTVYRMCVTGKTTTIKEPYLYRPVNRNNPFPSAVESAVGYASGDRTIGVNWQGLTHYITETYTTKTAPDFSIVLDTSTINLIKSKVEASEAAGETNIYSKEKYKNEADPTKKYLSSFIHEDLAGRFCYVNGVKQLGNKCP